MFDYIKVLDLIYRQNLGSRAAGAAVGKSKTTINDFIRRFEECDRHLLSYPLDKSITNEKIEELLYKPKGVLQNEEMRPIDYESVIKALKGKGQTLKRQWRIYDSKGVVNGKKPYSYRQFCQKIQDWVGSQETVNHFIRVPGENIELDYAGMQLHLTPEYPSMDEPKVTIFIATMSFSSYFYAEGMLECDEENWIRVCNNALQYFGGVTPIITPDNAKVAVNKNQDWIEPELNETFQNWAVFYGTAIMPAAVRKPRWKPNVENSVGVVTRDILVEMNEMKFFTLDEFNKELWERVEVRNAENFSNQNYSRYDKFIKEERPELMPLPAKPFEILRRAVTSVSKTDLSVVFDGVHYIMQKKYKGWEVEITASSDTIVIRSKKGKTLLKTYPRAHSSETRWVWDDETKPKAAFDYGNWSPQLFQNQTSRIGPYTEKVITKMLYSRSIPTQMFRACKGVLMYASKYSNEALEACCKHAVELDRASYTYIKNTIEGFAEHAPDIPSPPAPSGRSLDKKMIYKVPDEEYSLDKLIRKQEEKLNEEK